MRGLGWRERSGGGANEWGEGKTRGEGWREKDSCIYIYIENIIQHIINTLYGSIL